MPWLTYGAHRAQVWRRLRAQPVERGGFCYSSYRDPNLQGTLDIYSDTVGVLASLEIDAAALEQVRPSVRSHSLSPSLTHSFLTSCTAISRVAVTLTAAHEEHVGRPQTPPRLRVGRLDASVSAASADVAA